MYRTCFCLLSVLSVVCAANLGYLPRHTQTRPQSQPQKQQQSQSQSTQSQAYYYNAPSASTMAALRRIVLGHLQRFQEADKQRLQLMQPSRAEVQRQTYRQPVAAASESSLDYAVPPNSPTPKNYAMNFLPEGRDVVPGTSYIPLRLLLIR
ncbi:uncharacterized protein LOC132785736 [Drosophila nasuta]|uniref:uncharacterized protein LOC132785736 n=1 Tax=Drosophila nasuta TaxID=42062 RepID=UPI00295E43F9|nr:uncharacterized protein LOC132785736 [Drosophila nasuta]